MFSLESLTNEITNDHGDEISNEELGFNPEEMEPSDEAFYASESAMEIGEAAALAVGVVSADTHVWATEAKKGNAEAVSVGKRFWKWIKGIFAKIGSAVMNTIRQIKIMLAGSMKKYKTFYNDNKAKKSKIMDSSLSLKCPYDAKGIRLAAKVADGAAKGVSETLKKASVILANSEKPDSFRLASSKGQKMEKYVSKVSKLMEGHDIGSISASVKGSGTMASVKEYFNIIGMDFESLKSSDDVKKDLKDVSKQSKELKKILKDIDKAAKNTDSLDRDATAELRRQITDVQQANTSSFAMCIWYTNFKISLYGRVMSICKRALADVTGKEK